MGYLEAVTLLVAGAIAFGMGTYVFINVVKDHKREENGEMRSFSYPSLRAENDNAQPSDADTTNDLSTDSWANNEARMLVKPSVVKKLYHELFPKVKLRFSNS
ncbi:hypothetical protein F443_17366 [Phytophthora nicotianae P1569]|uniref:Uncharacterized protein n=1 Tax=Phytophthora nicotianae P1569 TaxID=1317065 RepID=V9EBN3_PHYNI|nr:hypothetical protein F443_17366 [Phytophthora nicotianae P1569]